jgi:hypothetical protein
MTYTPSTPEASDIIAQSQAVLKTNFEQLNLVYGTSGDHFPFDDTDSNEQFKHAKVTLPRLPQANPPGNVLPTPGAGEMALFCDVSGGFSQPYYRRDTATVNIPIAPIQAFGEATGAAVPVLTSNSYNISSVTLAASVYTFNFTEALADTNYAVMGGFSASTNLVGLKYSNKTTTSVNVQVLTTNGTFSTAATLISIMILRA